MHVLLCESFWASAGLHALAEHLGRAALLFSHSPVPLWWLQRGGWQSPCAPALMPLEITRDELAYMYSHLYYCFTCARQRLCFPRNYAMIQQTLPKYSRCIKNSLHHSFTQANSFREMFGYSLTLTIIVDVVCTICFVESLVHKLLNLTSEGLNWHFEIKPAASMCCMYTYNGNTAA